MYELGLPILRNLHDEHVAVLALLERLENFLRGHRGAQPPAATDATLSALLADLATNLDGEIGHHYTFEERYIFPLFAQIADGGIPAMLRGEHDTIRPVAALLAERARAASAGGFTAETWQAFRDCAEEMIEREVFHIQKEEMGLLPALDRMLAPEAGEGLTEVYAALKAGGGQ